MVVAKINVGDRIFYVVSQFYTKIKKKSEFKIIVCCTCIYITIFLYFSKQYIFISLIYSSVTGILTFFVGLGFFLNLSNITQNVTKT